MSAKIDLENIWFSYSQDVAPVLHNVNLSITEGEIFVIAGQCGCGKSTLAKIIVGLLEPQSGKVMIDGRDVNSLSPTDLFDLRSEIGFIFQNSALISNMSVFNNIALPVRYHLNKGKEEIDFIVSQIITKAGLSAYQNRLPAELSIGQRKRAAVARALILNPKLMIYDEPTAGLDPINALGITDIIKDRYHEYETTSVIITHDMPFAFSIAKRIALMYRGKIIFTGTKEELLKSDNPFVKVFLESCNEVTILK